MSEPLPAECVRRAIPETAVRAEAVERVLTGQTSLAEVRRQVFFDTLSQMQAIPVRQTNGAAPTAAPVAPMQGPVLLNQDAA